MVAAMSASAPSPLARPRVVSGVQPSGVLHLGNFFGAIQQHLALQERFPGEALYFIADYHALTTVHEAAALREHTREVAIAYLALGLDPAKALLFRQSDVPEVLELAWMLSCVSGMGLLERGHSYKDKVAQGLRPSVGLFYYPVLMAADILLYSASVVPVGRDQLQHIEFAQDMATHFNQAFAGGGGGADATGAAAVAGAHRARAGRPEDE
jgi:tryptophanyl-tRNA synthetase